MTAATAGVDAERVARWFERLPSLVAGDADLIRRGRFLTCDFEIGIGSLPLMVSVAEGRVSSVARGPFLLRPWVFAIRMSAADWLQFLRPIPEPGWHDIMALTKLGAARVEGNLQPFMANLQYVKDVLAAPRALTKDLAA
ncbi:MAG TPA: hypothetical protein VG966_05400 [Hyphomicrobiaceae bacterium]|nr:hypothetical protein [Hyphomicrobiaceae bacterium]